jgi:predicted permease
VPSLVRDVRLAIRLLTRAPGFTVVTLVTLAIGIGANTAIFSVVYAVAFEPLPYPAPDRLVRVFDENPSRPRFPVSPANFLDYRERAAGTIDVAGYLRADLQLAAEDRPEQLHGMRVTAGFFRIVGPPPAAGREFEAADESDGAGRVVMLSHELWQRRFGGDPSILGRAIDLSGRSYLVVGIAPAGFQHVGGDFRTYAHGERVDIWWPLTFGPKPPRGQHYLNVVGRFADGVSLGRANEVLSAIGADLDAEHPQPNRDWRPRSVTLADEIAGPARPMLLLLSGAVTVVLLITCVNIAGLLVARGVRRARETAVRAALGASRGRIVRQLAVESATLATVGTALGLLVARAAIAGLVAFGPDLPRLTNASLDGVVVAYAAALAFVTALAFGLAPALQVARADVSDALKEGGRSGLSRPSQRMRRVLVTAQLSLAFVLLVAGGLLIHSFINLMAVEPGFRADRVLTLGITLPSTRYPDSDAVATFFGRLVGAVEAEPGVVIAGAGNSLPWSGYDENLTFGIAGRAFTPDQVPSARYHFVTPGYLGALGEAVLDGRGFTTSDDERAPAVVLVNEAAARLYWPDAGRTGPLGARLDIFDAERTVVGVVGDVKDTPWAGGAVPAIYLPFRQAPFRRELYLVARGTSDAAALAGPISRVVRALDPALPVWNVRPLEDVAAAVFAERRFTLWLVSAFGIVALALAVMGTYGVMAQLLAARLPEFGVRRALGAPASHLLILVLGDGLRLAVAGVRGGAVAALAVERWFASLLFGVSPGDPWTLLTAAGLLLVAAVASGYPLARRASRIDPSVTLRAG